MPLENTDDLDERLFRGFLPQPQPVVSLSHQQICQKAVSFISKDAELSKRDDVLVNLVINVCLPDVTTDNLLELLETLSNNKNLKVATNSATITNSLTTAQPWDVGLLPEIGAGQEGEEDFGVTRPTDETPEFIGGLPAETGPGQEGVDNPGGNAGEDIGNPDWEDNDNWWNFPDTDDQQADVTNDNADEPPPSWRKKDVWELITILLANILDDDDSDSSSSEEDEDVSPSPLFSSTTRFITNPTTKFQTTTQTTTQRPTTEAPSPTTNAPPSSTDVYVTFPPEQPNRKNTNQEVLDNEKKLEEILQRLLELNRN